MPKIAIDAMGGDDAPHTPVAGAFYALQQIPELRIVLVGNGKLLEEEIKRWNFPSSRVEIIHASQVISMSDPPISGLRKKKDSSISVSHTLHRLGKVQAVVGAGNTGAQVASAVVELGRVEGVLRPVIGSLIPTGKSPCLLLDVGANTDCHAMHLFQFGIMGAIFVETVLKINNPRVGLLSTGVERMKGNDISRFAHYLFAESHLNFIGNIEGSDILSGRVEVAVCDGFVGNLLLKFAESFPAFLLKQLQETAGSELFAELKQYFKQKYNPEKYGGVPILGVKGISIVCHGASSPIAIANAVASAQEMCDKGINFQIAQRLSELHRFYEMNKFFLNFRKRWELRKGRIYLNPKRFFKWFSAQKTRNEN